MVGKVRADPQQILSQSCSWKNQQNNTDFMPAKRIRLPFSMVCMMFNSPFWKKGHTRSRRVSQVGGRSVALCCFSHYWLVLYLFLVNSFILGIVLQRLFLPSLPFSSSPPLPSPIPPPPPPLPSCFTFKDDLFY